MQDLLSKTTNGVVVQGPFAEAEFRAAGDACDFDSMRAFALHGKTVPWQNLFVVQAPTTRGEGPDNRGHNSCQPDEACLAAFLAAAEPYMYIYCQWDHGEDLLNETTFPEMDYHLGNPEGSAVELEPNVWRRRFGGGAGGRDASNMTTVVFWDNNRKTGNITWAGEPNPPPPPPPPPPPNPPPPPGSTCSGSGFLSDTIYRDGAGLGLRPAVGPTACCRQCKEGKGGAHGCK